jgi:hypothetical protein
MLIVAGALFWISALISHFFFSSRWWMETVLGIPWWSLIFMASAAFAVEDLRMVVRNAVAILDEKKKDR